jgi:hypothetical protein
MRSPSRLCLSAPYQLLNQLVYEAQSLLGCTAHGDFQLRTRQYIPEDSELHTRRRENLKSHNWHIFIKLSGGGVMPLKWPQRHNL